MKEELEFLKNEVEKEQALKQQKEKRKKAFENGQDRKNNRLR
jgi:hypothetical protein